jgi:eukaryotic-like serine/threonine-protein kinase
VTEATKREGARQGELLGGKYMLEDLLGVGGMGEVYRATNMSLGRKVAIKILSRDFVESEDDVLRFLREARAAAAVRHPNVVDVIDVARDDDGTPFIVQELLRGEDLEQHLKASGGVLEVDEVLELMTAVADAIAAAHEEHLVHRDLKPANIFLSRAGGRITPKVLDFGAALYQTVGELSRKERRMLIGTPHYMAPEQITSKSEVDARADVWAIGVLIYELLVGETPFEAETGADVMKLVRTRPPQRLRLVAKNNVPVELEEVVTRCLRAEPKQRYADAAELRDALVSVKDKLKEKPAPDVHAVKVPPQARVPSLVDSGERVVEKIPEVMEIPQHVMEIPQDVLSIPGSPPITRRQGESVELDKSDYGTEFDLGAPPQTPTDSARPLAARASGRPPPGSGPLTPPTPAEPTPPAAPAAAPRRAAQAPAGPATWPANAKAKLAATILVPALVGFGVLRAVSSVLAPLGRAMRGESMVASGVFTVLALVGAAVLGARSYASRSRGELLATLGAVLVGITMIIVTFASSEAIELGESPAVSIAVPFFAPLVPLGLALVTFARARESWPVAIERREAITAASLTSLLVLFMLVLCPIGAFATGRAPPAPPPPAVAPAP